MYRKTIQVEEVFEEGQKGFIPFRVKRAMRSSINISMNCLEVTEEEL
jgi:hypothetical protein